MILLHDADMGAGVRQLPVQVHTDAAAAQHRHRLDPVERAAHGLEHFLQLRLGTHHIQPVVDLRHKGAVGDDALVAPLDGADQHIGLTVAVGFPQTAAHKEVPLLRL